MGGFEKARRRPARGWAPSTHPKPCLPTWTRCTGFLGVSRVMPASGEDREAGWRRNFSCARTRPSRRRRARRLGGWSGSRSLSARTWFDQRSLFGAGTAVPRPVAYPDQDGWRPAGSRLGAAHRASDAERSAAALMRPVVGRHACVIRRAFSSFPQTSISLL